MIFGRKSFQIRPYLSNSVVCMAGEIGLGQELMSRSMQRHHIRFSQTDLLLDRISLKWDPRGSAMTNHKKLIDQPRSQGSFPNEMGRAFP